MTNSKFNFELVIFLAPLLETQGRLEAAHPHATWKQALIYGGEQAYTRQGVSVVPWRNIERLAPK